MTGRLNRDAAREVLRTLAYQQVKQIDEALDALEACIRPETVQTADRDELWALVEEAFHTEWSVDDLTNRILALLRPVDGVTLTREEAAYVLTAVLRYDNGVGNPAAYALAKRLEAAL